MTEADRPGGPAEYLSLLDKETLFVCLTYCAQTLFGDLIVVGANLSFLYPRSQGPDSPVLCRMAKVLGSRYTKFDLAGNSGYVYDFFYSTAMTEIPVHQELQALAYIMWPRR